MKLFTKRAENILILDIGSASIGCAVLSFDSEKSKPKVISSTRKEVSFSKDLNYKRYLSDVIKTLKEVVAKTVTEGNIKIDSTHVFMASPWFVAQTRELNYSKNNEQFKINNDLIDKLIDREVKAVSDIEKKEYKEKLGSETEVLEIKVIDTKVNGYSIENLEDKKARTLKIHFFVSLFSQNVKNTFVEEIKSIHPLETKDFKFHSFPCVSSCVLRDSNQAPDNFVVLDVNGEITDVSVVRENSITEVFSFPAGRNFFWRQLEKRTKGGLKETMNTYELYKSGQIMGTEEDKLEKHLSDIKNDWIEIFSKAIKSSSYEYNMPSTVYLICGEDVVDFFMDALDQEELAEASQLNRAFSVFDVHDMKDFRNKNLNDIFLSIETIFLSRIIKVK